MNKTSNFKGVINGKEYNSKEDYMNDLKKIFNDGETPITSISFNEEENYEEEDEDEPECPCCSCGCRDCKDESHIESRYCDCASLEDVRNGLMHSEHLNKLLTHHHMVFDYLFPHFESFDSPMFIMMKDPFSFDSDEMRACEDSMGTALELSEPFKQKILNIINQMNKEEIIAYCRLIENIIMNIKRTMVGIDIHSRELKNEIADLSVDFANTTQKRNKIAAEIKYHEECIKKLKNELTNIKDTDESTDKIEHNRVVINHLKSLKNIMLKFNAFYDGIGRATYERKGERYPVCRLAGVSDKPYTSDKGDCGKDPAAAAPIKTSTREVKPQEIINIKNLLNEIFEDPCITGDKKVTTEDVKKMLDCAKDLFGNTNGLNKNLFKPLNNEMLNKSIIPTEKDAKNFLDIFFGKDK